MAALCVAENDNIADALNQCLDYEPQHMAVLTKGYGLTKIQAYALRQAGDSVPVDYKGMMALSENEEPYDWPEPEIVQALLDKVDELEASEEPDATH